MSFAATYSRSADLPYRTFSWMAQQLRSLEFRGNRNLRRRANAIKNVLLLDPRLRTQRHAVSTIMRVDAVPKSPIERECNYSVPSDPERGIPCSGIVIDWGISGTFCLACADFGR